MRPRHLGVAAAVAAELSYGVAYVFTKRATGVADPATVLAWRFGVALVVLLGLVAARVVRVRLTRAVVGPLLLLAAFQPLAYYVGETIGVQRTTASESGLVLSAIPVANLVAAAAILRTRPSGRQVAGIGVTLVGVVATVVAGGLALGGSAVGYAALLGAVVAFALYTVCAERFAHADDATRTFVMVAVGAIGFGGFALARHAAAGTLGEAARLPLREPGFAGSVAFLAVVSTVAAFACQNFAIRAIGATRYATFIGVSTVAALAAGALLLGERPSAVQLAGGAAILAGVYLANRRGRRDARVPPGQPAP